MITVSAVARLMPTPPARVDSRKMGKASGWVLKRSIRLWRSAPATKKMQYRASSHECVCLHANVLLPHPHPYSYPLPIPSQQPPLPAQDHPPGMEPSMRSAPQLRAASQSSRMSSTRVNCGTSSRTMQYSQRLTAAQPAARHSQSAGINSVSPNYVPSHIYHAPVSR